MNDTDLRDIFSGTQNDFEDTAATAAKSAEAQATKEHNRNAEKSSQESPQEALARIRAGHAPHNENEVVLHYMAQGIPESDIKPRENCLTYKAWTAEGRQVMKGQHGCKLITFATREDQDTGETERRMFRTTVFHISQTKANA